jgi:hypothetical protein
VEGPPLPDQKDRLARVQAAAAMRATFLKNFVTGQGTIGTTGGTTPKDQMRAGAQKAVEDAYRALIVEAIPFVASELAPSMELQIRDPSGTSTNVTTADPAKINFDVTGALVLGFQGIRDPNQPNPQLPGSYSKSAVHQMFETAMPLPLEPFVTLTIGAVGVDPLDTLSVLLHEESHFAHAAMAIQLFERWSSSAPGLSFDKWLAAEVAAQRANPVEAELALDLSKKSPSGWHFNTEALAEVEGFMAGFHVADANAQNTFLDRFGQMSSMWDHADAQTQEMVIRKLQHYYTHILTELKREAFDLAVINRLATSSSLLFVRLAEFPTKIKK